MPPPVPLPPATSNRRMTGRRVTYEGWLEDNENYLLELYRMIQDANHTTGRRVLDSDTCSFPAFCKLAYSNSYLYLVNDAWMYEEESDDEDNQLNLDNA